MFTKNHQALVAHLVLLLALLSGLFSMEPIMPVLAAGSWYVATAGNDANSCSATESPCATINGAIGKASSGDTIYIAEGTYTNPVDTVVVQVSKDVILLGGWDNSFSAQTGFSTIDGQNARGGIR